LRAPEMSDFDAWHAFTQGDRSRFVRPAETSLGISWRAFAHVVGMWALRGYGLFVFCDKETGAPLGSAGPWHPLDWPEAEIGWSVWAAEAEGKGYAFEAASAARDHAFTTLGWDTAVSYIDPENARSIALAERLGATLDPSATQPAEFDCLVYRHPAPDADGSPEAYA
ncbi:MAG TPA: N-acetyltransferase, partial [Aliiroseovarius sp.]|nr:N-acetyltransferase [Aliiroseovarius sp.]